MRCFICKKSGDVTKFTESTLKKCLTIVAYRKKKHFKYGDSSLTRENSVNFGYHYGCYRIFFVLKQKYQEELEALFPSNASVSINNIMCINHKIRIGFNISFHSLLC